MVYIFAAGRTQIVKCEVLNELKKKIKKIKKKTNGCWVQTGRSNQHETK